MPGRCRFCGTPLKYTFVDLGMSPLSNAFLKSEQLQQMETFYPLHAYVCEGCFLVQIEEYRGPLHIFSDYAYFSSYSETCLRYARDYVANMMNRFGLDTSSQVVEIASNDGYLLRYFHERDIPVLGIEPAQNVAEAAMDAGIPTLVKFFNSGTARELVKEGKQADLLIGNNVLAHVPNLNDFIEGLRILLKPKGVITLEFPHLLRLIEENQFDTIYHEHFSYFSLLTVERIFERHGLALFDIDQLPTHGGSLRLYAKHVLDSHREVTERVKRLREKEHQAGINKLKTYMAFSERVHETKRNLLAFLIRAKTEGKTVVGYGAPAKGNTLLNYCGIKQDFIEYTVDRSPHKQGLFLPGTHIPIYSPEKISETKPDYVLILPWNLKDEIMEQMAFISRWGAIFVIPIPKVAVL